MENRVKTQGSNQAHLTTLAGMPEFHDAVGLIAKHGDSGVWQPPQRTTRIIWRAHWATVLCLSPRRSLIPVFTRTGFVVLAPARSKPAPDLIRGWARPNNGCSRVA